MGQVRAESAVPTAMSLLTDLCRQAHAGAFYRHRRWTQSRERASRLRMRICLRRGIIVSVGMCACFLLECVFLTVAILVEELLLAGKLVSASSPALP